MRKLLCLSLVVLFFLPLFPVQGAKVQTLFLIQSITSSDGSVDYKFDYNKDGSLAKETISDTIYSFSYQNGKISQILKASPYTDPETLSFSYKKENLTEATRQVGKRYTTLSFHYNKENQLDKIEEKGKRFTTDTQISYDDNGYPEKVSMQSSGENIEYIIQSTYDTQGNPTHILYPWGVTETIKNTYQKGSLIKKEITCQTESGKTDTVYTISYQEVPVGSFNVEEIEKQQFFLRNPQFLSVIF